MASMSAWRVASPSSLSGLSSAAEYISASGLLSWMKRTRFSSRLALSSSRWRIVTAVVTRASSNHFSTWDSMTATILKLRRKNSCSLKP